MPDQSDIDKILTNKLKKFNSERNLFFNNIYNETLDNCYEKGRNKVTKSNSFLKQSSSFLLKKCKSTKDLFIRTEEKLKTPILLKKPQPSPTTYYDPFEREYLFAEKSKNIVKELRKNFEVNNAEIKTQNAPKTPKLLRRSSSAYRKSEFSAYEIDNQDNILQKDNNNVKKIESGVENGKIIKNPIFKPQIPKIEDLFPQYYGTQFADANFHAKSYTISSRLQENNNIYQQYLQADHNERKYGAKRSGSLNHIDINILKAELDHFTDSNYGSYKCDYGGLKRYNSYKVRYLKFIIIFFILISIIKYKFHR